MISQSDENASSQPQRAGGQQHAAIGGFLSFTDLQLPSGERNSHRIWMMTARCERACTLSRETVIIQMWVLCKRTGRRLKLRYKPWSRLANCHLQIINGLIYA